MSDICLTSGELHAITGYKLAKLQLEWLVAAGYPAEMRPDNTVSLGRVQYERGPQPLENRRTLSRPTVQSIPRHGKAKKEAATTG